MLQGFSLVAVNRGYSLVAEALIAVALLQITGVWASLVVACGLNSSSCQALEHRLNSCGTWALLLCGM